MTWHVSKGDFACERGVNMDRNRTAFGLACNVELCEPLRVLTPEQVTAIDKALEELGPYSELRLVKQKGLVRYMVRVESLDISSQA